MAVFEQQDTQTPTRRTRATPLHLALIGIAAVAVLLQGLWAGISLEHDGERDAAESWVDVHATGGEVAIALTALATIVASVGMRSRRDLWLGSAALVPPLVLEAHPGGLIVDQGKDTLTAVHVPPAMALTGAARLAPVPGDQAPVSHA